MKNLLCLTLLMIPLVMSCGNRGNELPIQALKKEKSIDRLSDSSFFSDIRSAAFHKGKFIISDYGQNKVIVLDSKLELEKTLGSEGKGPGELQGASQVCIYRDSIFIINDYKRTIEVFSPDNHVRTIEPPQSLGLSSFVRFCLHNDQIFLANYHPTASISALSLHSDSITWFGNLKKYGTERETRIKNKRNLHATAGRIIAVPNCQPKIEMYNMEGTLLSEFDARSIGLVNRYVQSIEKEKQGENSYSIIFFDSYVFENQLFVLTASLDENDEAQCNTIIHFEVANSEILPKQILLLGKGWFNPICANGEVILTINRKTDELSLYGYE